VIKKDHKNDDESDQEKEWKFDKRKVRCYNCQKFGHFAKECWSGDGAKNKPKNRAHLAQDDTSDSEAVMLMARISCEDAADTAWYLDSGCSTHMTGRKEWFVKMNEAANGRIKFADNRSLVAEGSGRVVLRGNDGREVVIEEVLYVPGLKTNLISLGQLLQKGFVVTMKNNCLSIFDQNKQLVVSASLAKNRTFRVVMEAVKHQCFSMTRNGSEWLWHLRFGHLNFRDLSRLSQCTMVKDLPHIRVPETVCKECVECKQTRNSFQEVLPQKSAAKLDVIHSDVCGPMQVDTPGGSRYFVLFIDDWTRKAWIYLLKRKGEVLDVFKKFKNMVERQCGQKIKKLRSDGGGEYTSSEFRRYCEDTGIVQEITPPYTPEHNGTAERKNRTVLNMVRCMLKSKSLPKYLWGEAAVTATYILNRTPTKRLKAITPEEAWSNEKPSVSHLKVFGSVCYKHVPDQQRRKLDDIGVSLILVGYHTTGGYILFEPKIGQVVVSRDVVVDEITDWN